MRKEIEFPQHELGNLANGLMQTFVQRNDLYAKQLDDGRYVCVQKPLDTRHIVVHLQGKITLGAYCLSPDSQARFIVFDADEDLQFERLIIMAEKLAAMDTTSYLESSRRGGHLWLFFDESVSGGSARAFGKGLAMAYDLEGIELFPKQNQLNDGPGSLVRFPFGIHRKTGERYGFYGPDGKSLASSYLEQARLLSTPETVTKALLEAYRQLGSSQPRKAEIRPSQTVEGPLSQRIRASVSAFDFIRQYVELSPNGRGLCPFHDDHNRSFSVNPEKNYWHCFAGCGGGSIIDFWMKLKQCDFKKAIKELALILLNSD
jgi:hypothetical protein